jgi:hypothetical protein
LFFFHLFFKYWQNIKLREMNIRYFWRIFSESLIKVKISFYLRKDKIIWLKIRRILIDKTFQKYHQKIFLRNLDGDHLSFCLTYFIIIYFKWNINIKISFWKRKLLFIYSWKKCKLSIFLIIFDYFFQVLYLLLDFIFADCLWNISDI